MKSSAIAVSAPGKVLLAGGYLVLDRAHNGLVLGLNARINVAAGPIPTSPGVQLTEIIVSSPQFHGAQWRYGFHLVDNNGGIKVTQLESGSDGMSPNPFVEATLTYVLSYINTCLPLGRSHSLTSARLSILADNDYYSNDPTDVEAEKGRFARFNTTISKAPKTGLGSSAALVTALTGALLAYYLPTSFDISSPDGKRTLHNLAQLAHGAAQGKIGSGFDVAAAVYGSCIYRRFSPEILADLREPGAPEFDVGLQMLVRKDWDGRIKDFALPVGVAVRMVDVHSGTQTVGMVKRVLEWRKKNPVRATELWWSLHGLNMYLEQQLRTPGGSLEHLPETISQCRSVIRTISKESRVPIEPPQQTELLDKIAQVPGVFGAVVPGAGGFDAAAVIMKDDEATLDGLRKCCEGYKAAGVKVDLMRVKAESEGARVEDMNLFEGWLLN